MYCRLSGHCWSNSILELWEFDGETIKNLESIDQVTDKIASTSTSPMYNFKFVPTDWLGDITYDESGKIVGARAAKMLYVLNATSTNEFATNILVSVYCYNSYFG